MPSEGLGMTVLYKLNRMLH